MTLLRTNRVSFLDCTSMDALCYSKSDILWQSIILPMCTDSKFSLTVCVLVILLCGITTSSAQSACRCSERKSSFGECKSSAAGSNAEAVKQCSVRLRFPCGGC